MQIKVIFSDIDGTLTDGRLYYGPDGEALKVFHVKDGLAIKRWMKSGGRFGVISARSSEINHIRMKELGVSEVILGTEEKQVLLDKWLQENGFSWENLGYIGDDLNDLPVLERAGFSAAPADAAPEVLEVANYCCRASGGQGAFREWVDFLLDQV